VPRVRSADGEHGAGVEVGDDERRDAHLGRHGATARDEVAAGAQAGPADRLGRDAYAGPARRTIIEHRLIERRSTSAG